MSHHTTIEIVEQNDDTVDRCFDQLNRLLQEVPRGFPAEPETSPCTIFKIPQPLRGINPKAEEPEIVSIGPYHWGHSQVLKFERHKPLFLKRFLRRCKRSLRALMASAASIEPDARRCYSEPVDLTSHDFLQMMLLDGCFVVEFLLHPLFGSGDAADKPGGAPDKPGPIFENGDVTIEPDPIVAQPQMISILIRDLLKLENQIPYSVLDFLFHQVLSSNPNRETGSLALLALKLFNHAYPRPMAVLKSRENLECEHLLDLFYMSLSPTRPVHPNSPKECWSSAQSVSLVTELRPSGVKFKSKKADSLLDINFHKPMLWNLFIAIKDFMISSLTKPVIRKPNIAIKDFMTSLLTKPVIRKPNIAIKDFMTSLLTKPVIRMPNIAIKDFMTSSLTKPVIRKPNIAIKDFMTSLLTKPVIRMPNIAIKDFMTSLLTKPVIRMPNIAIKDFMTSSLTKPVTQMPNIAIKDFIFMTSSLMKPVIQMPNIGIDDFMTTVLINCVSLEQCRENRAKYMSDYVSFMHCLINQPKDVSLLRSDGIIALYSRDDQYVADLFNKLGKGISFNVHECFLSKQFEELGSYYHSNWAKMMRTYFVSPWSAISLFSAFLVVVLTITQTVIAILAYHSQP